MASTTEKVFLFFTCFLGTVYLYLFFSDTSLSLSFQLISKTTPERGILVDRVVQPQPQKISYKKINTSTHHYHNTLNLDYFHSKDFLQEPPPDNKLKTTKELVKARIIRAERFYLQAIAERNWYLMSHPRQRNKHPVDEIQNIFKPAFKCPHDLEQVGVVNKSSGLRGNWVCGFKLYETQPRPTECIVYTFGLPFQSDFEKEWVTRTDCKVFKYHVRRDEMGVENQKNTLKMLEMQPYKYIDAKSNTLRFYMEGNDHGWLDILVLDIQHITYDVLNQIINEYQTQVLPFAQLIVQFPVAQPQDKFSRAFVTLESFGMRPFHADVISNISKPNAGEVIEYSFFNLRGKHLLLVGSQE